MSEPSTIHVYVYIYIYVPYTFVKNICRSVSMATGWVELFCRARGDVFLPFLCCFAFMLVYFICYILIEF